MKSVVVALALTLAVATAPTSVSSPAAAADEPVSNGPLLGIENSSGDLYFGGVDGTLARVRGLGGFVEADFAPDGASLALQRLVWADEAHEDLRSRIDVRHSDGSNVPLGTTPAERRLLFMSWVGNGKRVVAVLYDDERQTRELWRYEEGRPPQRLLTFASGAGEDPAADGRSDLLYFDDRDGIKSVDTSEDHPVPRPGVTCADSESCVTSVGRILDLDPVHHRLLYEYSGFTNPDGTREPGGQSFLDLSTGRATTWRRGISSYSAFFVPDGTAVFTGGRTSTRVFSADPGAAQVGQIGLAPLTWQPCPGGDCPVFVAPVTAPQSPRSVAAGSGARGRPVTAKASWTAPAADGGRPVLGYQVDAARLRSGRIVKHTVKTAPATARSLSVRLPAGRYRFRVRAVNEVGSGAWSAYSGTVAAR